MSKCETCVHVISCDRSETKPVQLAWNIEGDITLSKYLSDLFGVPNPLVDSVPVAVWTDYIFLWAVSPYHLTRRVLSVVFRLADNLPAFSAFAEEFNNTLNRFPPTYIYLMRTALGRSLQLKEWLAYAPVERHFLDLAVAAGFMVQEKDSSWEDLHAKNPCHYWARPDMKSTALVTPFPSIEAAIEKVEALIAKTAYPSKQEAPSAHLMFNQSEFEAMPPVGGVQ